MDEFLLFFAGALSMFIGFMIGTFSSNRCLDTELENAMLKMKLEELKIDLRDKE